MEQDGENNEKVSVALGFLFVTASV